MTGLDGIRVNHAALDQASADMYQTVQAIDARMNQLETDLEPLRNQWGGDAQVAYAEAKRVWDDAILQMRNLLDESQRTVFESNRAYIDADKRGSALFQR